MAQSILRQQKANSSATKKTAQLLRVKRVSKKSKNRFIDLGSKVTPILRPYVNRISVFGSYARGDATAESDIDLLIALKPSEMRPMLGLFDFIKLENELEKKLGCEVDLVTEEGLNPRRKLNIEKDTVILYKMA
jgi:predicted nucleotidyltransferase